MKLADKILDLRKKQGMSQENLAEKLNVSRQAVSRWEMGTSQPDVSNIVSLSRLFGVTTDYLLNDDFESNTNISVMTNTSNMANDSSMENNSSMANNSNMADTKKRKIIGVCVAAVGLLGNFVIYIISRMVKVMVPSIQEREDGTIWYHWSSEFMDYNYKYFVQEHNLEFLIAAFWLLVLLGIVIILIQTKKKIR